MSELPVVDLRAFIEVGFTVGMIGWLAFIVINASRRKNHD